MEAPTGNFVARLRDIRANLREALLHADNLEFKLVGPRPSDAKEQAPKPTESVSSMLSEINALSLTLMRTAQRHHEILGEFGEGNPIQGSTARYA